MAQVIVNICDYHMNRKNDQVPGETHTIFINGEGGDLDLCQECFENYVVSLADLMELARDVDTGKTKRRKPRSPSNRAATSDDPPFDCEVCDFSSPHGSPTIVRQHYRREHNVDAAAVRKYGITDAMAGKGVKFVCKFENCKARFWSPQGIASHLRSSHYLNHEDAQKVTKESTV